MLACIACAKPELEDGGEDTARAGTPSRKDNVKSLSSQLKDMVLKFSGAYRQCRGGSAAYFRPRSHQRDPVFDEDEASGRYAFLCAAAAASSSSAGDAWDLPMSERAPPPCSDTVTQDEGEPASKEWVAQVEPGVHITFLSLPGGFGNDLKRIRFSREMFNKWQAQRWWGENYDRIMELYNVQKFSRQALPTPPRSDDGCTEHRESFYSRTGSTRESPVTRAGFFRPGSTASAGRACYFPSSSAPPDLPEHVTAHQMRPSGGVAAGSSVDASRTTTSSRDEAASVSASNASDLEAAEWVEQDDPGVYITIRELPDGSRELRRVRFRPIVHFVQAVAPGHCSHVASCGEEMHS